MRGVDNIMATDDDMEEIDLAIDDLGWPNINIPIPQPGGTIPVGGGTGQSSWSGSIGVSPGVSVNQPLGGGLSQNMGGSIIPAPAYQSINIIDVSTKTMIQYVIVPADDITPCLELCEQQVITPREIIGIAKFISTVNTMIATGFALKTNWSELVKNLGITRHFKQGHIDMFQYDNSTEVLYLFLFDDV